MRADRERLLDIVEAIGRIDKDSIWAVVQRDLPDLKRKPDGILREM